MDAQARLKRTLLWVIGLRAVAITGLFAGATFASVRAPGTRPLVDPFFALIAVTYGLTAMYAATVRVAIAHRSLIDAQVAADAALVTAVVVFTGGLQSYLVPLYALPIVAASALQCRRGGLLVALASAGLYAAVVGSQYAGMFPAPVGWLVKGALPSAREACFTVVLNACGFVAIGLLTEYLASDVRSAGQRLERASTAFADLQAFNQYVIDSLTGGLITTDRSGTILTFNRAASLITGLSPQEASGRSVAEVLQLPEPMRNALEPTVTNGLAHRLELPFQRNDGVRLELGLSAAPLVTANGRAGFIFSFQDVTEARRREREAEQQKRLAAVGEMAAGIAHEIRNPLASMTGSIQVLRQELPLNDEQAQLMDIVLRESERLNDTIGDFLAYARPQRPVRRAVDVRPAVEETVRLIRHSPDCGSSHRVLVEATPEALVIDGDEAQLRQILWNLATNGLRAMPDGGTLRIHLAADGDGWLALRVEDEGIGVRPDEIDGIFEPFNSTFANGTGLGLPIVHRIVSEYGGSISAAPAREKGTVMTVRLPLHGQSGPADDAAGEVAGGRTYGGAPTRPGVAARAADGTPPAPVRVRAAS